MKLSMLEQRGFRFRLNGDRLTVQAPDQLLDEEMLADLRQCKAELLAEYRLRKFLRLVQAFGVSHGRLLDLHQIRTELDEADLAELMTSTTKDRQTWAELLAYRLTEHGAV